MQLNDEGWVLLFSIVSTIISLIYTCLTKHKYFKDGEEREYRRLKRCLWIAIVLMTFALLMHVEESVPTTGSRRVKAGRVELSMLISFIVSVVGWLYLRLRKRKFISRGKELQYQTLNKAGVWVMLISAAILLVRFLVFVE